MRQDGIESAVAGSMTVPGSGTIARVAGLSVIALVLANCANQPAQRSAHRSKEIGAFSHPKYGKASPRVVGLDESAPKGGGRYQVGRPYTIAGRTYYPREKPAGFTQTGAASWYGIAFHGRKTANGEIYDRHNVSAAHPTMPLPSYARVTNLNNNHSIVVRVNDRGPYHGGRVIDLSERTASLLQFRHIGTARVRVEYLGPASIAGSDDTRLVASLRTGDGPAEAPFVRPGGPVLVASAEPVASARPSRAAAPLTTSALGFTATAPVETPLSRPEPPVSREPAAGPAGTIVETRFVPANLPLPPERPFDLETIAGAASPVQVIAPARAGSPQIGQRRAVLPPVRPTELAFEPDSGFLSRFGASHPYATIGALVVPSGNLNSSK